MFRAKDEEKINIHFILIFFFENRAVYDSVEKYCTASKAIDENIKRRIRIACWILTYLLTYLLHVAESFLRS